jgi:DNA-binding transcriptional MerR regulator
MSEETAQRTTATGDDRLTIAEASARTGLSVHTLRYYERVGLVDGVARSAAGRRRYAAADLDWLAFLLRLRGTGMSIAGMQRFAALRRGGPATIAKRLELLRSHMAQVNDRIGLLRANATTLEQKIALYESLLHPPETEQTT